ncbi:MAG TPA: hypothetical protein VFQ39_04180, partial [Longimicrobium sp.]|nr:hypothetical protein [Longimicrobium sp.]
MNAVRLPKRLPLCAALALAACTAAPPAPSPAPSAATVAGEARLEDVRAQLYALADDSMQGRMTGTEGMFRAARYIARELRAAGVEPAGDDGYL